MGEAARRQDVEGIEGFLGAKHPRRQRPAEPVPPPDPPPLTWRGWLIPAALFLATCGSTWYVAGRWSDQGWVFAAGIMTVLTFHELGHFFLAHHHGVQASPPYFIPLPLRWSPFGTLGAIIVPRSRITHSRALFDIAAAGPLAGLLPALIFTYVGLKLSKLGGFVTTPPWLSGKPLLFQFMERVALDADLPGLKIEYHPLAVAGWTGLFITALNLIPIGQLDGGHILYALERRWAFVVSVALFALAVLAIVIEPKTYWPWTLMLFLLLLGRLRHEPTEESPDFGRGRKVLGWLLLAFVFIGFTPSPFPI